jgi:Protein of unknown function, DUF488
MTVFTIGHSTREIGAFIALLRGAATQCVADVRRFPFSRRYPQFNEATLSHALAEAGIGYRHFPALGGRRSARRDDSPHTLWREPAFRNYADYAETSDFRTAFAGVRQLAHEHTVAVMCAEAVWWRCHRRIIADYLIAAGFDVRHILAHPRCDNKTRRQHPLPSAEPAVAQGPFRSNRLLSLSVIPAKAGIHRPWTPAFAGGDERERVYLNGYGPSSHPYGPRYRTKKFWRCEKSAHPRRSAGRSVRTARRRGGGPASRSRRASRAAPDRPGRSP